MSGCSEVRSASEAAVLVKTTVPAKTASAQRLRKPRRLSACESAAAQCLRNRGGTVYGSSWLLAPPALVTNTRAGGDTVRVYMQYKVPGGL